MPIKTNQVRLSDLSPGTFLEYQGGIVTAEDIRELLKNDEIEEDVYMVSDDWVTNILHQAYDDYQNGITNNVLSAPNNGMKIILDL